MNFSQKDKMKTRNLEGITPRNFLENKVTLAVLKDVKDRLDELNTKISVLEKKLETIPHNTISSLYEQYYNGETTGEADFYSELAKLNSRLSNLEKKFEQRIPEKVLSELKFKEEVQDSEQLVNRIISEIKALMPKKPAIKDIKEPLTIDETKRIKNIISLLERHEKLTSSELSQLIGLSRTRCNEYFKLMENLDIVEPVLAGREKFYKLKA
jgi:hypothetical protein